MTRVYLRASRGRQQDHGRVARVRGIDMHRVSMAALMAAVVSVAGVGLGPAQSVEMRPGTERPAVQERDPIRHAPASDRISAAAPAAVVERLPPIRRGGEPVGSRLRDAQAGGCKGALPARHAVFGFGVAGERNSSRCL